MPEGTTTDKLTLTVACAQRVKALRETEGNANLMLRIAVSGGGCSGFQYGFSLDDAIADDDLTFERDGVKIVVDETSLGLLEGSEVDYKEDLGGAFFQITNPNATSSCGCGSSFAI
ncbi:MAG: iron-sulfur cluster insertion protein ErpA [Proteobacteria bacterium]|nr:iron-sulfur cluster insertion protein ErpA [Pseudomonadota bacterium]